MNPPAELLGHLIQLAKIDAAVARMALERKRLDTDLKEKAAQLKKIAAQAATQNGQLNEKRERFRKEERSLKDEQAKLVDRRKALTTFSNYKLQEAAEREIDSASRQLGVREESLIEQIDEVERIEGEVKKIDAALLQAQETLKAFEEEVRGTLTNFEERERDYRTERESITPKVDPVNLRNYEKVRDRHPTDPIMQVKNSCCAGCFVQVGPQVLVSIHRGDTMVKCPGCGRILYVEAE